MLAISCPVQLRRAIAVATCVLGALSTATYAQTGLLNDTGQAVCDDGTSNMTTCSIGNTGDSGNTMPRQDGRFGRDPASAKPGAVTKTGGGDAGFDFTRICWNGSPEGTTSGLNPCTGALVANDTDAASGTPATDWACTRDNVTGLVWSLQSGTVFWDVAAAATYPDAGHNTPVRCGFSGGWRLPTAQELLGLVHAGLPDQSTALIDMAYFPGTRDSGYWASETDPTDPNAPWVVHFSDGTSVIYVTMSTNFHVRLVRGVP